MCRLDEFGATDGDAARKPFYSKGLLRGTKERASRWPEGRGDAGWYVSYQWKEGPVRIVPPLRVG